MEKITYSYARQNLSSVLDTVINDAEAIFIERKNGKKIALIDADEYNSMVETLHLFNSPVNAKRLEQGIQEAKNGLGEEIDLQNIMDS